MLYNYTNGYAWLTYLEYPVLLIQEYVIIALVVYFTPNIKKSKLLYWILIYGVISAAFAYGYLSKVILKLLLVSLKSRFLAHVIVVYSRARCQLRF